MRIPEIEPEIMCMNDKATAWSKQSIHVLQKLLPTVTALDHAKRTEQADRVVNRLIRQTRQIDKIGLDALDGKSIFDNFSAQHI